MTRWKFVLRTTLVAMGWLLLHAALVYGQCAM